MATGTGSFEVTFWDTSPLVFTGMDHDVAPVPRPYSDVWMFLLRDVAWMTTVHDHGLDWTGVPGLQLFRQWTVTYTWDDSLHLDDAAVKDTRIRAALLGCPYFRIDSISSTTITTD